MSNRFWQIIGVVGVGVVGSLVLWRLWAGPYGIGGVALGIAVALGSAATIVSLSKSRKKRASVFGPRESLKLEEIYQRFYADGGLEREAVERVWTICAAQLRVPAGKLRPTDRFDGELAAADFLGSLDDPVEDLASYARAQADARGARIKFQDIHTFDALIRVLVELETNGKGGERGAPAGR